MKKLLISFFSLVLLLASCGPKQTYEYPFQNPDLNIEERIDNLMSLLTVEEKVGLMMNMHHWKAPAPIVRTRSGSIRLFSCRHP